MPAGELTVPVSTHPSGLWVGIYVDIGARVRLFMVLETGSPVSALSPSIAQHLHSRKLLQADPAPGYFRPAPLTAAQAPGHPPLPDLAVRVLPRLTRLRIDGLLGLDFFRRFDRVCFQLSAMRLELTHAGA